MKKPEVNYLEFRPSKLNTPQFSHLKLLLAWFACLGLFFLSELLVPTERCTPMHMFLDDWIPFQEIFVLAYVGWFLLIAGSLGYFLLYRVESFRRLQVFFIVCQLVAVVVYVAFPSCQELRPETFPRDNVLTRLVGLLYSADTNTGVCPSLHVAFSFGIASAWLKEQTTPWWVRGGIVIACVLAALSTMFIKQHSAVDFFAAIPLSLLAEGIAYGKGYWLPKMKNAALRN